MIKVIEADTRVAISIEANLQGDTKQGLVALKSIKVSRIMEEAKVVDLMDQAELLHFDGASFSGELYA